MYLMYLELGGQVNLVCGISFLLNREWFSHVLKLLFYESGPQPFWHQGPISWKTIFFTDWDGVGGWLYSLPPDAAQLCSITTCHSLIGFWYEPVSNWFIMVSGQSNLSASDDLPSAHHCLSSTADHQALDSRKEHRNLDPRMHGPQ